MNDDDIRIWGAYKPQASTAAFLEEQRIRRREEFDRDCEREVRQTICGETINLEDAPLPESAESVSANVNKSDIDATLDERGKRYGSYMEKAFIIQEIKRILRSASSWERMDPDMQESLDMVIHKIGRIVTGDPEYLDSWIDVIGYAKLVADRLEGVER
jgi:hypothetical protein